MSNVILPDGAIIKYSWDRVLNQKPALLLHCDGADGGTIFKDSGGTGHTVIDRGGVQTDTAQKKFGVSALLFDNIGDYFAFSDHADWDISTNWTVDFWVKHAAGLLTDYYVAQYENTNNYWALYHSNITGLNFSVVSGGSTIVSVSGTGVITDTDWHHIALCKVGNEYGIYKDGTQISHTSDADTDTFAGELYVGTLGAGAYFIEGWMDEIRIVQANVFCAAPVSGKTDIITVPDSPYVSWR